MGIVWTLLVGLVVGALAKFLMPGKDGGGIIKTMILGVVGSWVAWGIGVMLGWYGPGESPNFFMAIGGAIVVLILYRVIFKKKAAPPTTAA